MTTTTAQSARRASAPALVAAALLAACGETGGTGEIGGVQRDRQAPLVGIDTLGGAPDTVLAFTVRVRDNLDVVRVQVALSGGITRTVDTTLAVGTTSAAVPFRVLVPRSIPAGTPVRVLAQAWDGARNVGLADTTLAVGNLPAPQVSVTAPAPGAAFVIGKASTVAISAASALKVQRVGWVATGAFVASDSTVLGSTGLPESIVVSDTVRVPATATAGVLTITPFVVDSANRRVVGVPVAFSVQATPPVNTTTPTLVVTSGSRLERLDTLVVTASDQAGITAIGYEIFALGDTTRRLGGDSVTGDGTLVNSSQRLAVSVPSTVALPAVIRPFAVNSGGTRGYARTGTLTRLDTLVLGTTVTLPAGGRVADGLFHPRTDRLYLTNIERNTLEVFDMATMRFRPSVSGFSNPWGIAAWPRDRNGTMGDTVLVANSGGTTISYVDVNSDREVFRYPLPNIVAYSITTTMSSAGVQIRQATKYDFSDRPQFLATTCTGAATATACGDPVLVYSTSPTGGQSLPFPNKGSVRWENLRTRASHFIFEHATGQTQGRSDTLRIVRYAADRQKSFFPADPDSTVLVDDRELLDNASGDSAVYSIEVDVPRLGFRDTTFLRNSGNFRRAMLGEGGAVQGSRAMMYDASRGLQPSITLRGVTWNFRKPPIDLGISPAYAVSDVVANTFTFVRGVALNFDGAIGAVRADSTYLVDPTLRLQGTLQTTGGQNAGFDFHPLNTGPGSVSPSPSDLATRLSYSASAQPQLEVYDTWCYRRIATLLVRDPIIGPVKASRRSNGDLVLVGATARGVTIVPVPRTLTSSCS